MIDQHTNVLIGDKKYDLAIVTPVLNDWPSLEKLIEQIGAQTAFSELRIRVIAVDDGSSFYDPLPQSLVSGPIIGIDVVHLYANQGHQRAIALGLAFVARNYNAGCVIIMDSDGEDRPEEAARLYLEHKNSKDEIIVAKRRRRSESFSFRLFYQIYKFAFKQLTGKDISFGNFSLIPYNRLPNVVFNDSIWNSYAATLLRSRIPLRFVETDRGKRYFGQSTMNFTSLMLHGLGGIAAFSEVVIGRIIAALAFVTIVFAMVVIGIVYLKFGAGLFVPGYATIVILFMTNMLVNAMLLGFLVIVTLLASRNQQAAAPVELVEAMTRHVDKIQSSKAAS